MLAHDYKHTCVGGKCGIGILSSCGVGHLSGGTGQKFVNVGNVIAAIKTSIDKTLFIFFCVKKNFTTKLLGEKSISKFFYLTFDVR